MMADAANEASYRLQPLFSVAPVFRLGGLMLRLPHFTYSRRQKIICQPFFGLGAKIFRYLLQTLI